MARKHEDRGFIETTSLSLRSVDLAYFQGFTCLICLWGTFFQAYAAYIDRIYHSILYNKIKTNILHMCFNDRKTRLYQR